MMCWGLSWGIFVYLSVPAFGVEDPVGDQKVFGFIDDTIVEVDFYGLATFGAGDLFGFDNHGLSYKSRLLRVSTIINLSLPSARRGLEPERPKLLAFNIYLPCQVTDVWLLLHIPSG